MPNARSVIFVSINTRTADNCSIFSNSGRMASASCCDSQESTFFSPVSLRVVPAVYVNFIGGQDILSRFFFFILFGLIYTFKVNSLAIARTRNGDVGRFAVKGPGLFK